jgi:hypothetical protein
MQHACSKRVFCGLIRHVDVDRVPFVGLGEVCGV